MVEFGSEICEPPPTQEEWKEVGDIRWALHKLEKKGLNGKR